MQAKGEFLSTQVDLMVKSPVFVVPPLKLRLEKDFNQAESYLELDFEMVQADKKVRRNRKLVYGG